VGGVSGRGEERIRAEELRSNTENRHQTPDCWRTDLTVYLSVYLSVYLTAAKQQQEAPGKTDHSSKEVPSRPSQE
ncbi:uncharacterized, partial [Tachysurus ichikawai]